MTQPKLAPSSEVVNQFHANADIDTSPQSLHHSLGIKHNQASPGDHKHDGKSSRRIGSGINVGFPSVASATYSQSQVQAIIDALRALGLGT
jgi:hypothetical protein